jgi:hypothetical protein
MLNVAADAMMTTEAIAGQETVRVPACSLETAGGGFNALVVISAAGS